jgi:hypothetical protein
METHVDVAFWPYPEVFEIGADTAKPPTAD